jgi:FemAB-related protein (PEP-CTERM system-associated)
MSIAVGELDEAREPAWSEYVDQHCEGTFCHTLAWCRAVEVAFRHERHYLIAVCGGQAVGVLPMFLVQSALAGPMLVSVPYGVYGGILADDGAVAERLFEAARDVVPSTGAGYLEFRSRRAVLPGLPVIDRYVTFVGPLPASPEGVVAGLPRKARAAVRSAREKFGLTVEFGDEFLSDVWRLYCRSMRRLGSLNYPLEFFEQLVRLSPGQHLVQIVRYGGRAVAGVVSFVFRQSMMPYFAGCDERYNFAAINNYMYAALMEQAVRMGLRYFDFGRSRKDNLGVMGFKRHQGFSPQALGYQSYLPPNGWDPQLDPSRSRYRLAGRIWRHLPLALTRPLGARLARSVPG